MIKVYVATIPFSGMSIKAPLDLGALNARLQEGSEAASIQFLEPPLAELTLTRTHGGVLVKGVVSGRCSQDCSTCAESVPHTVSTPVSWLLQSASERGGATIDDPGVVVFDGDHVDLEDPLQEALLLELHPFWHPPRDAEQRCTYCNRDCSRVRWGTDEGGNSAAGDSAGGKKSSTLGDLLAKAARRSQSH